jgi:ribose 5-phosphate isomerase A
LLLSDLEKYHELDLSFDGADEVDQNLVLIKGGGGCLTQEKIIASCSKRYVIVCDFSKISKNLGDQWTKGVPIEVIPMSHCVVKKRIESSFGGRAELRYSPRKMGPLITDNGNFILDWIFEKKDHDWKCVDQKIKLLSGVVETGLFVGLATEVVYSDRDGLVQKLIPC